IIEDDPYSKLRFEGQPLPPIKSLDSGGRVILLRTLSKTICPGIRPGMIVASPELTDQIVKLKQPTDLCSPELTQRLAYEFMVHYDFAGHIAKIREIYREKRDAMLAALEEYMPKHPEIRWTHPEGGFFVWLTLPESVDTREMFPHAVEQNVAYVVGQAFFVDGSGRNTMRLSFSEPSPELIREGIKRLAGVVEEEIAVASAGAVS
ncbi:MAG: PLP-dependent aminotransferase family protein, partial [Candidatus Bipolaricaulia bacterium]